MIELLLWTFFHYRFWWHLTTLEYDCMTLEIWPWPVNTKVALITAARSKPVLGKEKKSNQYLDFMMIFWIHLKIIFGCVFIIMWLRRFSIFYLFFSPCILLSFFSCEAQSQSIWSVAQKTILYISGKLSTSSINSPRREEIAMTTGRPLRVGNYSPYKYVFKNPY